MVRWQGSVFLLYSLKNFKALAWAEGKPVSFQPLELLKDGGEINRGQRRPEGSQILALSPQKPLEERFFPEFFQPLVFLF